MRNIAGLIALVALATCLLLAGRSSVADGNQCETSSSPVAQKAMWRMEVGVDETAFSGPSVKDRLAYNWNDEAKIRYRWTSVAMPVDADTSTKMMAISATVIADGVPALEKGDIVDVYVVSGIDYSKGRAPTILRRVCSGREEGCLDELRKMHEGRVAGVAIGSDYSVASDKRFAKPLGNLSCVLQKAGCSGELAAVLR